MTSILFPNKTRSRLPKLHVSAGTLQPFIDPKQPPTKRSPWRQIRETSFISSVAVILPSDFHQEVWTKVDNFVSNTEYAKVFMSLEEILTGDFFNNYIKVGNILMISEGQPGVDNLFTLSNGILRLDLGKEDYQRAGLQGIVSKTHGARKHTKERYNVEYNLRAPSMVKGKSGFDRLLYAARNALSASKVWLFRDLMPPLREDGVQAPIMKHHPTMDTLGPTTDEIEQVAVPEMVTSPEKIAVKPPVVEHDDYYEITEWLDLVSMRSPRVQRYDRPDTYISRYTAPGMSHGEPPPTRPISLKILKWQGLMDSEWVTKLMIELTKHSRSTQSKQWLAITINAYSTQALGQIDGYTILLQPSSTDQQPGGNATAIPEPPKTQGEDDMQIDTDKPQSHGNTPETRIHTGLQQFMCFQFVDS